MASPIREQNCSKAFFLLYALSIETEERGELLAKLVQDIADEVFFQGMPTSRKERISWLKAKLTVVADEISNKGKKVFRPMSPSANNG